MKKSILILLIASSLVATVFGQAKTFTAFNTKLKIKDVIGTTNLYTSDIFLDLPDVLVKNEDYYLKTIGSYRNYLKSTDPNILFNITDKGDYPLLDPINIRWYDEIGIQELKSDTIIRKRADFKEFCKKWEEATTYQTKKALLFKDEFIDIGNIIQQTRFQKVTKSNFNFSKEATTKLSATIKAEIEAELKARNIEAKGSLVNYLSRIVSSKTAYSGVLMVVEFDDRYMSRLKNSLNGLTADKIGEDDFAKGLKDYAAANSLKVVTTGLVIFKLIGVIDKSTITEDSLKADISAKFKNLDPTNVANIASAISFGYVSKVTRKFDAEINNIYIRSYLTSQKVDVIEVQNKIQNLLGK